MNKRIGLLLFLLPLPIFLASCTNIPGMRDPNPVKWLLAIGIVIFAFWYVFKRK